MNAHERRAKSPYDTVGTGGRLDIPCDGVTVSLHRVGDIFAVMEAQIAPSAGQPNHRHPGRDKIFEVLEGEIRFTCAGEDFDLEPGTSIIVARGVEHSWCNQSGTPARMLFSFFPDHPGGTPDFRRDRG